eukprot:TRINITY_DN15379_c0_g1_i2.p1 TRINITY_DN15379_c0_g1~~TRINITY_DN15379_c0_g1_i2.p1  ORF type:complete len:304 (+),score=61.91 TRINITY_DN15379_c0_g1_i2:112-1023(+)
MLNIQKPPQTPSIGVPLDQVTLTASNPGVVTLITPREGAVPDCAVEPARLSAEQQLMLAGVGRASSTGRWSGVDGAIMQPAVTVVSCEFLENANLSTITTDGSHGAREGDAVGVQPDAMECAADTPLLVSPRGRANSCIDPDVTFISTGLYVMANVHQSWFHVSGDASNVLYPGQRVMVGSKETDFGGFGRDFTIHGMNYSRTKHETFIQLDRVHEGHVSLGDQMFIVFENLDTSFVHSGLFVDSNVQQTSFSLCGDASQMISVGSQIQVASLPSHGRIQVHRGQPPRVKEVFGELVFEYDYE